MPYIMEYKIKELVAEVAEKDKQIAQLKRLIKHNAEEIKSLKSALAAFTGNNNVGSGLQSQTALPAWDDGTGTGDV